MRLAALAFAACLAAGLAAWPASAQREAISSSLSPEAVAQAFRNAVVEVCAPAVMGEGVGALPAARRGEVRPTSDPEMRRQAGAAPDETVWDVMAARGGIDDAAVGAAASTGHAAGLDVEARRLVVCRDRATANTGIEMGLIAEDYDHFPYADQGVVRRDLGLRVGEAVERADECGK